MTPEIAQYLESLDRLRGKMLDTLTSSPSTAWNWKPTGDETNSLLVLATHTIGSEHGWLFEILGEGEKTRDRPQEFLAQGADLTALQAKYEQVATETTALLSGRTTEQLGQMHSRPDHGDVTERWIILHVIEHYGEHLGQMYLTRQLWEQQSKG